MRYFFAERHRRLRRQGRSANRAELISASASVRNYQVIPNPGFHDEWKTSGVAGDWVERWAARNRARSSPVLKGLVT